MERATSIPDRARYWQMPELAADDRVVAGVSAGIARELGLDPLWVRLGFVVLFATGGWGALLYGAAWGLMALAASPELAPDVLSRPRAEPGPDRPAVRHPKGRSARTRVIGFALLVGGTALLTWQIGGFPSGIVWPLGLLGVGLLIGWQLLSSDDGTDWRSPRRWLTILAGLGLSTTAVVVLATGITGVAEAAGTALVALGAAVAMVGLSAPWWWRLVRERDAERQARIRSDERAEVAAHLHDSVLQTLTLIQRNSDDPQVMVNLARRQERELRNWLDPNRASRRGESLRGRLDEIAIDVEQLHGVRVEVVTVGDHLVDERIEALVGATREATVNAAKHAGADRVDLYLEVGEEEIEVFVRDTGRGFDVDTVGEDRQGLRRSIIGRMERVGGAAVVTSSVGQGTEVELRLRREGAT